MRSDHLLANLPLCMCIDRLLLPCPVIWNVVERWQLATNPETLQVMREDVTTVPSHGVFGTSFAAAPLSESNCFEVWPCLIDCSNTS